MAPKVSDRKDDEFHYRPPCANVLCGDLTVPWQHFDDFVTALAKNNMKEWIMAQGSLITTYHLYGLDAIQEVRTCRESMSLAGWAVGLSSALVSTRRRKASVAADMVFGMLAMLDRPTINELALDVSMSAQQVFVRFGKHYIRNEVKECLLNHVATRERMPGLASWCPNFASLEETVPIGTHWLGHHDDRDEHIAYFPSAGFKESGKWALPTSKIYVAKYFYNILTGKHPEHRQYDTKNPRQISLVEGSNSILASGVVIDTIVGFVDCNPAADSQDFLSEHGLHQTLAWDEECLALAEENLPFGKLSLDTYARTITANRVAMVVSSASDIPFDRKGEVDFAKAYYSFKEHMQAVCDDSGKCHSLDPVSKRFADCLGPMSRRRRFFLTRSGRIGLGPSDTQIGDTLVVIFFCPTPYLLRSSGDHWQFVGETYVHGLMYGEALDILERGEVQETRWIIG